MEKIYFIIQINMVLLCCIIIATPLLWLTINQTIFLVKLDKFQAMLEKREKQKEQEESDLPENNLVEFVGEDENGNGIYKLK